MKNDNLILGFAGLGLMGAALARRLLQTGATVHVFDLSPANVARLVEQGAVAASSPQQLGDEADIVFGCLPTREACFEVAFGPQGIVQGRRARVYVEMSTIGQRSAQRMAQQLQAAGITLFDAPVSGGPKGADAGTLTVICSGPAAAKSAVMPWLQHLGKNVFDMGDEAGLAQTMKLVNNILNAANMACAFEALVMGAKAGLDPDQMVDVINVSTGCNSATLDKVPKAVLTGSFDYGSRLAIMYKDVKLALEEAEDLGVTMLASSAVGDLWRHAMNQGGGDKDFTALITYLEDWAGAQVRSRSVQG